MRLYIHLFIRILLYFDGVKKKWKKKKKRKNEIQNFSRYPWNHILGSSLF